MVQIIPGILEYSINNLREKIDRLDSLVDEIHIDLVDEQFAKLASQKGVDARPSLTLDEIEKANLPMAYSLHLMVIFKNIDDIKNYCLGNARGLIVYYDAYFNTREMLETIRSHNKQAALAIEPETQIYEVEPYLDLVDYVVVMGYQSGKSGQQLIPSIFAKIEQLHQIAPDLIIGIDGGISTDNSKRALTAGATLLIVNSAIFGQDDIKVAIDALANNTLS